MAEVKQTVDNNQNELSFKIVNKRNGLLTLSI